MKETMTQKNTKERVSKTLQHTPLNTREARLPRYQKMRMYDEPTVSSSSITRHDNRPTVTP
jgi:hypothetical protein